MLEILVIGGVALSSGSDIKQRRKVGQNWDARSFSRKERLLAGLAKPQSPFTQVVPDSEQQVNLAHRARGRCRGLGPCPFGALDQRSSPAVRQTVGEAAEQRTADRRLQRAGDQRQCPVQLVGSGV